MLKHLFCYSLFIFLGACAVRGDYSCGPPANGVRCQPMSVTHQQLYDGTLNSLHTEPFADKEGEEDSRQDRARGKRGESMASTTNRVSDDLIIAATPSIKTIESKQAILSQPRHMRIWFNRFTDIEGDLHDESFVFVRIDNGHWVIDNNPVVY